MFGNSLPRSHCWYYVVPNWARITCVAGPSLLTKASGERMPALLVAGSAAAVLAAATLLPLTGAGLAAAAAVAAASAEGGEAAAGGRAGAVGTPVAVVVGQGPQ